MYLHLPADVCAYIVCGRVCVRVQMYAYACECACVWPTSVRVNIKDNPLGLPTLKRTD